MTEQSAVPSRPSLESVVAIGGVLCGMHRDQVECGVKVRWACDRVASAYRLDLVRTALLNDAPAHNLDTPE